MGTSGGKEVQALQMQKLQWSNLIKAGINFLGGTAPRLKDTAVRQSMPAVLNRRINGNRAITQYAKVMSSGIG